MEMKPLEHTITRVHRRDRDWVTVKAAAELAGISRVAMYTVVKEIKELEGIRYPKGMTPVFYGKQLVNRLVLNDYIKTRDKIKVGIPVEDYSSDREVRELGFYSEQVVEVCYEDRKDLVNAG